MSYILEALKRSDEQRQQRATPTLTSLQLPLEEAPRPTGSWVIVLAAIIFAAGLLLGWLQPWNSGQAAVAVEPPAEQPIAPAPGAKSRAVMAASSSLPADAGSEMARSQGQAAAPQPSPVALLPAASAPPIAAVAVPPSRPAAKMPVAIAPPVIKDDLPPVAVRGPAGATPASGRIDASKSAEVVEQNVMARAELPVSVQQELPAMAVSLHAYSAKASSRLVGINDKLLQEGDALAPGLVLEEITRKDMIFSYKGFRFRQAVH